MTPVRWVVQVRIPPTAGDMRLFNTLTGTREEFAPLGPQVRMYVCGITPYDAAHVGHAMKDVVFDVLRRYLEWRGFDVLHVQNQIGRAHV